MIIVNSLNKNSVNEIKENFKEVKILFSEKKLYAGQARNLGLESADSDYYALIDSDVILPNNWTEQMLNFYQNSIYKKNSMILSGSITNAELTRSYFRDSLIFIMCNQFLYSKKIIDRKYLSGCNLFFNDNTKPNVYFPSTKIGEDVLMTNSAYKKGTALKVVGPNLSQHLTHKNLFSYSYQLGVSSYVISLEKNDRKIKIFIKLLLGQLYKLIGIFLSVIIYSPNQFIKFLFYSPGIILGLFFYHLGMIRRSLD